MYVVFFMSFFELVTLNQYEMKWFYLDMYGYSKWEDG